MSDHISDIQNNNTGIFYQHFNQFDNSILTMRVRIIKQVYHRTDIHPLATLFFRYTKGRLLDFGIVKLQHHLVAMTKCMVYVFHLVLPAAR